MKPAEAAAPERGETAPAVEPVTFAARDGRELAGLHVQATGSPRGALVINGATGFPREFYLKLAQYGATRGYHALVYDYRGMGASAREPLAAEPARMSDWGTLDMPAALAWLAARHPALPIFTLGHSVGGQFVGFLPPHARLRGHVMVAASIGYWRWQLSPFRYLALFFWKVWGPLMLSRHGYVTRGRVWTGQPLPRGVFEQWREWCLRPEHFAPALAGELRDNHFAAVRGPVLLVASEDDPIATRRTVAALLEHYPNAQIEQRWLRPADLGVRAIGHHGFFSERHRGTLWRSIFDWLDGRI